ncbi:endosome-associated-trafficking regulator 1 [Latimeria chalumnae]|nr:PREDICTED: serologically defined colon cancer antigen 3 [Latimeria chalumnae]|eukprot:XP_005987450.1 PREDICTED: serologically defined colon cancer antigen 3 [Latimeria chalumnae]
MATLKPTLSVRSLIIGADEMKEESDERNPFSFKEFIKNKNPSTEKDYEKKRSCYTNHRKKTGHNSILANSSPLKSPDLNLKFQEPFFKDPTIDDHPLEEEEEEEDDYWCGSYQPCAIEEAHEFEISRTFPNTLHLSEMEDSFTMSQLDESTEDPILRTSTASDITENFATQNDFVDGIGPHSQHLNNKRLKEENAELRKMIKEMRKRTKDQKEIVRKLEEELEGRKIKEEKEAQALELMVQQVEENLELMTKRAVKAENMTAKLKQEILQLKSQLDTSRAENKKLRAGEAQSLSAVKHNAQMASKNLSKIANNAQVSLKQLVSEAGNLQFVADLLKSIDNITEVQSEEK